MTDVCQKACPEGKMGSDTCLPRAVEVVKAHFERSGPQKRQNIVRIRTIWGDLVLNGNSEGRKGWIWVPKTQPVNWFDLSFFGSLLVLIRLKLRVSAC